MSKTKSKVASAVRRVVEVLDEEVDPKNLSRSEYREVLDELQSHLSGCREALDEEEERDSHG